MDSNNEKAIREINERLDSNDEIINNVVKKTTELEKQVANKPEINMPEYLARFDIITNEIKELKETYKKGQQVINDKLDKMPKSATKLLRFLLFPETNQGQYYKIVFGRLIPWGFGFMLATYIFVAGYKAIEIYRYNRNASQSIHYEEAWLYLRQHSKKKTIAAMDDAFNNTGKK